MMQTWSPASRVVGGEKYYQLSSPALWPALLSQARPRPGQGPWSSRVMAGRPVVHVLGAARGGNTRESIAQIKLERGGGQESIYKL